MSTKNEVDVCVCFISSVVTERANEFDFTLSSEHPDFGITGLKKSSVFKTNKVLTLERTKIIRRIGKTSAVIQKEIDEKFKSAFGIG